MSWSVSFIGTSEKVSQALKDNSEKLSGKSKEEFDAVLPHLCGLVEQNTNAEGNLIVRLHANGHGYEGYNQCEVNLTVLGIGVL